MALPARYRGIAFAALALAAWGFARPAPAEEAMSTTVDGGRVVPDDAPASDPGVDPLRFGKVADPAFGAYQRGLYITALNLALPKAKEGDAAAQTLVAEIYSRGLGVRRDEQQAARWYQAAAEQGVPAAQFQLALLLIDGRFVDKDEEQAFALMEDAANSGNALAQFNYAQMLLDRSRGADTVKRAVSYYEKAARAGIADAQYAMAQVYESGVGGRKIDEAEARRWLTLAARRNFDTAQVELGTWMINGVGGDRDEKGGFAWLKRAAESGNVAAQNRVAKLYRAGVGVEADPVTAAAWYILARRAGLSDIEMDDFLQGLTDEERKDAIARANRLR
jgi:TPR repeat protein